MPDVPYTQKRSVQFRGPNTSEDYNARIEENYKDIVSLYNKAALNDDAASEGFRRFVKDQLGIARLIADLENRVGVLEQNANHLSFYNDSQIDVGRFDNTAYSISSVDQCDLDIQHGVLTLPLVPTSSMSKLAFVDNNGNTVLPSTLTTAVVGVPGSADDTPATIDTSLPEMAIARLSGRIWERNVVVSAPVSGGAEMWLYVQAPTDLFTTANANVLMLHPFPAFNTDILEIAYSTSVNIMLNDNDNYQVFAPIHVSDPTAVGWLPPGSWTGDEDYLAGFRTYYFDPLPITALRIKLGQRNYFTENGQYVYSYGASLLDLRYHKFLSTGQTIIRFDAPDGSTISSVSDVEPSIYNVAEAVAGATFSYQLIWETSYNSGVYTDTPIPFSKRVWVKITLNQTPNGGTPALSGLSVTYS